MRTWLDLLFGLAALAGGAASAALVDRYLTALERRSALFAPVPCLQCGRARERWDRVPLLSWLLNGGKCRFCGAALSRREPVLSFLILALWPVSVQLWLPFGAAAVLLVAVSCTGLLCALGVCRANAPDKPVLLPLFLCAGLASQLTRSTALSAQLIGAAGLLAFCLLLRFLPGKGQRLRLDSLCYLVCAGFLMGWKSAFALLPAAVLIMAVFRLTGRRKQKSLSRGKMREAGSADPGGGGPMPDLCLLGGGAAALLFGRALMNGYLRIFSQIG